MKGLLIQDLPYACYECDYCDNNERCLITFKQVAMEDKRDKSCPFIEIDSKYRYGGDKYIRDEILGKHIADLFFKNAEEIIERAKNEQNKNTDRG